MLQNTNLTKSLSSSTIKVKSNSAFQTTGTNGVQYHYVFFETGTSITGNLGTSYSHSDFFHKVTFNGPSNIGGSQTIDTLMFTATVGDLNYVFNAYGTQTINNLLSVTQGSCAKPNFIKSSSAGIKAKISKTSGSVTFNYCNFYDMQFQGGASFTGNNVVYENGNNTGITLNLLPSTNYYWVGGTGNWSDPTHWAISSGGVGQSPTGCVPTIRDNVFFDANSFSSVGKKVTVDIHANCKSMSWVGATNNPEFYSTGSYSLSIYGSLTFIAVMNENLNGILYFNSTLAGQTITTAGQILNSSQILFSGTGEYILQDNFKTGGNCQIKHNYGTLNTNNKTVETGSFESNTTNTRTLTLGTSTIILNGSWVLKNTNITASLASATIKLNGSDFQTLGTDGVQYHRVIFNNINARLNNSYYHSDSYHSVSTTGNSSIVGANTFDSLLFLGEGAQYVHTLTAGSTQNINEYLKINSNGCFLNTLKSSSAGAQATISMPAGVSFNTDFIRLQDIRAQGGATFNAGFNSVDLGNNTGWTFTGLDWETQITTQEFCKVVGTPLTLYNDGDPFTRSVLWSTGATTFSIQVNNPGTYYVTNNYGVNCLQSDTFKVFNSSFAGNINLPFTGSQDTLWQNCYNWTSNLIPDSLTTTDIPAGKRVYIGRGVSANCKNLVVNPGAVLTIGGGELNVYGNITNNGTIIHTKDSVIFRGNSEANFNGSNAVTFYRLKINKWGAGKVTWNNNGYVSNELKLVKGIIDVTSPKILEINSGATCSQGSSVSFVAGAMRKTGSSDFVFPVGDKYVGRWARLGIAGLVSSSTFQAEYTQGKYENVSCEGVINKVSWNEYWKLDRIAGASGARTKLYFESGDFSGITAVDSNSLRVCHFNGANWEDYGWTSSNISGEAGYVEGFYKTSFSPFTFGRKNLVNSLPIELLDFKANYIKQDKSVALLWTTLSESNTDYFTIEKTMDGKEYKKIGQVKAAGNSNEKVEYNWVDFDTQEGLSYYQIKEYDLDGTLAFTSDLESVNVNNEVMDYLSISLYPNPSKTGSIINFTSNFKFKPAENITIALTDINGSEVSRYSHETDDEGHLSHNYFSINDIPEGVYIVSIYSESVNIRKVLIIN